MEDRNKSRHPIRTVFLVLLLIIILIAAFPFIYDRIAGFDDYDDIASLASSDAELAIEVGEDGIVCASADKAAVYSYASKAGAKEAVLGYIYSLPFCTEERIGFTGFGYSISEDRLGASLKAKLFGFLPVQIHADADIALSADEIAVRITDIKYGRWFSFSPEKCADKFNIPELSGWNYIDISPYLAEYYLIGLSAKDDVIYLKSDIINRTVKNISSPAAMLSVLGKMILGEDSEAARIIGGDMSGIADLIKDPEALSDLLEDILKYEGAGSQGSAEELLQDIPFPDLDPSDIAEGIEEFTDNISDKLREYEEKLDVLRDNYKEMKYFLSEGGLFGAAGAPAESELPAEWGARTVLQYNKDYESIVKANDGSFSPGVGWSILPNPKLTDLKRRGNNALPKRAPGITVYDLTVALRTADGTPAILFLTALDELGINVISEELYGEIVSSKSLPVYCSSEIISPSVYHFVTPDKSQRDLCFYMP